VDRAVNSPTTKDQKAPRKDMPEAMRRRKERSSSSSIEDTDSEDGKRENREDGF
jgi:hypothetical protein